MPLSDEDINKIETLIICEGLESGLRNFSEDLDSVKDRKFRHLLNKFLEAAEDLEHYLVNQGVDIHQD